MNNYGCRRSVHRFTGRNLFEIFILGVVAVLIVMGFLYAVEKSLDNRCNYYNSLPYPTESIKELCEK